ncbi:MAG: DUF1311 domain-containing protein [Alphaproteobacteria bacterium]|nr:DUF1311 domain-containing protein [Alphaproteobacteria bacterium]
MRLAVFAAVVTIAAAAPQIAAARDCRNPVNQNDMNTCAEDEYKATDAKLNAIYKKLLPQFPDSDRALLRNAQRAWLGFRDAECKFRNAGNEGGSIWPMVHFGCMTGLTRARIRQLEAAMNCQEGDLSCNQPQSARDAAD